ncbi:uncharacterized protein [Musca autumnalis]|uniref:uncharacterized protein n=1 Tax=Musca autumnalis TaxID=221902 RepID=UPI003CE79471
MSSGRLSVNLNSLLVLLLFCSSLIVPVVVAVARFTNIKCTSLDKEFSTVDQCALKIIKRNVVGLNVVCKLLKGPVNDVNINIVLYKRSNGYQPFLINATGDLCKFFENRKRNQVFNLLADYFLRSSNINHTCPYDHDLIVENLILDSDLFSALPLQNGDYMFKVLAGNLNNWKVEFKVYFRKS